MSPTLTRVVWTVVAAVAGIIVILMASRSPWWGSAVFGGVIGAAIGFVAATLATRR